MANNSPNRCLRNASSARLVRQQLVQSAVQAIVVYPIRRHAQQISQRALPVKVFGDIELARRLAEPRDDQDQQLSATREPVPVPWASCAQELV